MSNPSFTFAFLFVFLAIAASQGVSPSKTTRTDTIAVDQDQCFVDKDCIQILPLLGCPRESVRCVAINGERKCQCNFRKGGSGVSSRNKPRYPCSIHVQKPKIALLTLRNFVMD
ncbi:uncharacterized protein [Phaseolus vulgaris]|uniref:uncharacterized protein n=1 Tax=Phaseolus vulgaris TaxID=3885 RepID=UPI0035CB2C05